LNVVAAENQAEEKHIIIIAIHSSYEFLIGNKQKVSN